MMQIFEVWYKVVRGYIMLRKYVGGYKSVVIIILLLHYLILYMKNSNGWIDILYLGTKNTLKEEEERVEAWETKKES